MFHILLCLFLRKGAAICRGLPLKDSGPPLLCVHKGQQVCLAAEIRLCKGEIPSAPYLIRNYAPLAVLCVGDSVGGVVGVQIL